MNPDDFKPAIEALKFMLKKESIDYLKIKNIMNILDKTNQLDETSVVLFNLLLLESEKVDDKIRKRTYNPNERKCTNCGGIDFTSYTAPHSGLGTHGNMKPSQNVGDLILEVCKKCSVCIILKPKYWA